MAFQLSPGVLVVEKDLTGIVPAVATSIGGYVGAFQWGPVDEITTLSNEGELLRTFGKPNDTVASSWFSAANFLSYANNLKAVRVVGAGAKNAVTSGTALLIKNETQWEATYAAGAGTVGQWAAKFPGALGNSLKVSACDASGFSAWDYRGEFDSAPGTSSYVEALGGSDDEMHLVVVDEDGLWTGVADTVLEKFAFISKAADAKKSDGSMAYYLEVLRGSRYIYWMDHPAGTNWGSNAQNTTFDALGSDDWSLTGGVSDDAPSDAAKITGWDLFANAERVDVNLVFNGPNSLTVGKHIIENIAQSRMDCLAFVSPTLAAVYNNSGDEADDIISERQNAGFNVNSSYGVMDTGWKYKAGVNPVVTFLGEGTVLFGDKTLLAKPSAFDRINVRRLFIVLEKAIATAGKYQLFEFNDAFTRAQFRNLVEPFLRDVKGRRGIYDFKVVCDETNNTGEVIDRNEFVADIYIKPARSINFMQLNFIATRTGVSFEEVVGA